MRILATLTLLSLLLIGCESKATTGVSAGGALSGGKGVHIGGANGVVAGGLTGASLDEQDRRIMERTSPKTIDRMDRAEPLTVSDIVKLHEGGIGDETIVRYIHDTRTTYNLSQVQIKHLQNAGISQRIINYMIDTGR